MGKVKGRLEEDIIINPELYNNPSEEDYELTDDEKLTLQIQTKKDTL
tara:strand:+ start:2179 stop:2319 length:141 start_codon:yes stop_codon:yes gene_type:complete